MGEFIAWFVTSDTSVHERGLTLWYVYCLIEFYAGSIVVLLWKSSRCKKSWKVSRLWKYKNIFILSIGWEFFWAMQFYDRTEKISEKFAGKLKKMFLPIMFMLVTKYAFGSSYYLIIRKGLRNSPVYFDVGCFQSFLAFMHSSWRKAFVKNTTIKRTRNPSLYGKKKRITAVVWKTHYWILAWVR